MGTCLNIFVSPYPDAPTLHRSLKPCDAVPACRFRQEYINIRNGKEALPKAEPGTDGGGSLRADGARPDGGAPPLYCATCKCTGEVPELEFEEACPKAKLIRYQKKTNWPKRI